MVSEHQNILKLSQGLNTIAENYRLTKANIYKIHERIDLVQNLLAMANHQEFVRVSICLPSEMANV